MADRLDELRRQRLLLQQHVDWLDAEIAQAECEVRPPASPPGIPAPVAAAPPAANPPADADAILSQFRSDPGHLQHDVRKGCLLYFGVAMLLLGVGVAALYFLLRRNEPMPSHAGPEMSRPAR